MSITTISTSQGKAYLVIVADTWFKRAKGLMFREELGIYDGMLFVFPKEGKCDIWMLNMRFSLDILWLDRSGKILKIAENVKPGAPTLASPDNVSYVLELKEGTVQKDKIALGDKLSTSL